MLALRTASRFLARPITRSVPLSRSLVTPVQRYSPSKLNSSSSLITRRFYSAEGLNADEVKHRIMEILLTFDKCDPKTVNEKAHFVQDLGLDSLDVVEVVMAVEEEFAIEIPDEAADRIMSVPDAIAYVSSQPEAI